MKCRCGYIHTTAFSVAVHHLKKFSFQIWGFTFSNNRSKLATKFTNDDGGSVIAVYDEWWREATDSESFIEPQNPLTRKWSVG